METTPQEEGTEVTQNQTQTTNEGNTEDNNDTNEDNENNDENAEEEDEGEDIFTLMYGRDEDYDESDGEDNDNLEVNNGFNLQSSDTNNETETQNQRKRSSDSANSSSYKRRSEERDSLQNKRIKSEPLSSVEEKSDTRMTTTIEAVAVDETPPPPQIPNNSYEFMSYLLDLNANHLEANESETFSMIRNLQDIRQTLRFDDLIAFKKAFIPYILTNLWRKLNYHYNQKDKNSLKYFLSILTKIKSTKMKNGLEMKCISFVQPKGRPVFQFGQIITIQTAVQSKPNSTNHMINRRKYFGYITSHIIRGTDADNQTEVNHLRLVNESKRDSVIVEEITFMTKYSDELFLRNDTVIIGQPIVSVHNNYMEARTVFKFDEFVPLWKQIFNPIFSSKPSGLSVTVNERKFNASQIEMIQIGLDVAANTSASNSFFYAINGSNESPKTTLLMEIIRQIVLCKDLNSPKVLFSSSDINTLRNVEQILRSRRIKTYLLESDVENSLKDYAIKHIEYKLSKELDPKQKELYQECFQYFEEGHDLSVEGLIFKNSIMEKLRLDLQNNCSVIIGRIEDLCNDIMFYKFFAHNQSIHCCVIDGSESITEPQLYSLMWFGIKRFLFGGDFNRCKQNGSDICRAYGLSRSFFERYYSLHLESNDNTNHSTVFSL